MLKRHLLRIVQTIFLAVESREEVIREFCIVLYERRVIFMKNIIINNVEKIAIGIAIFSISGLLYVVKELSKYDC